jgi:hypothetical protein
MIRLTNKEDFNNCSGKPNYQALLKFHESTNNRFRSNNWKKMHGVPMRRRYKNRSGKVKQVIFKDTAINDEIVGDCQIKNSNAYLIYPHMEFVIEQRSDDRYPDPNASYMNIIDNVSITRGVSDIPEYESLTIKSIKVEDPLLKEIIAEGAALLNKIKDTTTKNESELIVIEK